MMRTTKCQHFFPLTCELYFESAVNGKDLNFYGQGTNDITFRNSENMF